MGLKVMRDDFNRINIKATESKCVSKRRENDRKSERRREA